MTWPIYCLQCAFWGWNIFPFPAVVIISEKDAIVFSSNNDKNIWKAMNLELMGKKLLSLKKNKMLTVNIIQSVLLQILFKVFWIKEVW